MAYDGSRLAAPHIQHIGILSGDWGKYGVVQEQLIRMDKRDRNKCYEILGKAVGELRREASVLLRNGWKCEMQAIAHLAEYVYAKAIKE